MIPPDEAPRIGKFIETESRIEVTKVTRSWGKGEWGLIVYRYRVSVWDDEKVLEIDSGDGVQP